MLAMAGNVNAQLLTRGELFSTAVGGVIGGVIGHNSHGHTAEGVAIGAGTGLLLGKAITSVNESSGYYGRSIPQPQVSYYQDQAVAVSRPNYAVSGAVVGGIVGGIIGHNSHGHTAEGVAIGAGSGLLLGSLVENQVRKSELRSVAQPAVILQPSVSTVQPQQSTTGACVSQPTQSAPQAQSPTSAQGVVAGAYAVSSMQSANALFGR